MKISNYFFFLQIGKIIPFNVVIDNIIQLNSETQNKLQAVKRELKKYKSLRLTPEQEEELRNLVNIFYVILLYNTNISLILECITRKKFRTRQMAALYQSNVY